MKAGQVATLAAVVFIPPFVACGLKLFAKDLVHTNHNLPFWVEAANITFLYFTTHKTVQCLLSFVDWRKRGNEAFWREIVAILAMSIYTLLLAALRVQVDEAW